MQKHLRILSLIAPVLCVGALSVSSHRFNLTQHTLRGAGAARAVTAESLRDARFSTPSASTVVVTVVAEAAVAYAVEESYVGDVAAWAEEQVGE